MEIARLAESVAVDRPRVASLVAEVISESLRSAISNTISTSRASRSGRVISCSLSCELITGLAKMFSILRRSLPPVILANSRRVSFPLIRLPRGANSGE